MVIAMASEKPLSPEKELLKLIEKPMAQSSLRAAAVRYHGKSFFSFGALKGRVAFLKNKTKEFKAGNLRALDVKALNMALLSCIVLLVAYAGLSSLVSMATLKKEIKIDVKKASVSESDGSQVNSLLKATSYYLEKARERDIFTMNIRKPVVETGAFSKGPSQRFIEMTQNFKLVGISWSDDPDVMIEDTKNPRTLFLKKGQLIDNEIRLQAVFKDKVILSYNGEEIELR